MRTCSDYKDELKDPENNHEMATYECSVDGKTSPDFTSASLSVDNDKIFIFV